jgi:hypothetical protein
VGTLIYGGSAMEIGIDDRALAHLQIVVGARLQARERFFLSWRDHSDVGSGRSAVWIDPSVCLVFRYSDARPVRINRAWLDALSASDNGSGTLILVPEPGVTATPASFPHSRV